jgi:hypothetical protein
MTGSSDWKRTGSYLMLLLERVVSRHIETILRQRGNNQFGNSL